MSVMLHQRRAVQSVYVYDLLSAPWSPTGQGGVRQKVLRADLERGEFMGLVQFEPLTAPGLHQHLAPATSLMLNGAMQDYQGTYGEGVIAINPTGATHDAMSWGGATFIARLEGPVLYPSANMSTAGHTGAQAGEIVNRAPEALPALDFHIQSVRPAITSAHRVSRRMLFDYSIETENRRFVELLMLPGAEIAAHRVTELTEWVMLAGDIRVNSAQATSGSAVILEPGVEVTLQSEYGCRFLAWAHGPIEWLDGRGEPDFYGF
jgi:ChrR Cupin-like domain